MLSMPIYILNKKKIIKWEDIEVIISHIKEEMRKFNTHSAKEFEQRFRDSWHDSDYEYETEVKQRTGT